MSTDLTFKVTWEYTECLQLKGHFPNGPHLQRKKKTLLNKILVDAVETILFRARTISFSHFMHHANDFEDILTSYINAIQ